MYSLPFNRSRFYIYQAAEKCDLCAEFKQNEKKGQTNNDNILLYIKFNAVSRVLLLSIFVVGCLG